MSYQKSPCPHAIIYDDDVSSAIHGKLLLGIIPVQAKVGVFWATWRGVKREAVVPITTKKREDGDSKVDELLCKTPVPSQAPMKQEYLVP